MDRSKVKLVTRLLAKAESTDSDAEAEALLEKSCGLLAKSIDLAV